MKAKIKTLNVDGLRFKVLTVDSNETHDVYCSLYGQPFEYIASCTPKNEEAEFERGCCVIYWEGLVANDFQ